MVLCVCLNRKQAEYCCVGHPCFRSAQSLKENHCKTKSKCEDGPWMCFIGRYCRTSKTWSMHSLCRRLDCLKLVRICSIRHAFENYDKKKKMWLNHKPCVIVLSAISFLLFVICYFAINYPLNRKCSMSTTWEKNYGFKGLLSHH